MSEWKAVPTSRLAALVAVDGYFVWEGCHYETLADIVGSGMLGFCGCGAPEENLRYVLGGLALMNEERPGWPSNSMPEFHKWYERHKARCLAHFGSERAEYFFYYWCDEKKFSEHGGSVPGWLTDSGLQLLADLRLAMSAPEARADGQPSAVAAHDHNGGATSDERP